MKKIDLYQLIVEYKKALPFYKSIDDRIKLLEDFLFKDDKIKLLRDEDEVSYFDFMLFMKAKNKSFDLKNFNDSVVLLLQNFFNAEKTEPKSDSKKRYQGNS